MRLRSYPILWILFLISLAAMATPTANQEADKRAKQFTSTPSKAIVYIFRSEPFWCDVSIPLRINGWKIGDIIAKTYFCLELEPGPYRIVPSGCFDESVTLKTEASKVYCLWLEVDDSRSRKDALHIVDEALAREEMQDCLLLKGPTELPGPGLK